MRTKSPPFDISRFVPQEMIELLDELFSLVLDGRNSAVKDGVCEVLGRAPRDFATYARETAATGVWDAPR